MGNMPYDIIDAARLALGEAWCGELGGTRGWLRRRDLIAEAILAEREAGSARIAALEAKLAETAKERDEALEELGKVIMACPVGQRSMPISATVASMRARLSALEA